MQIRNFLVGGLLGSSAALFAAPLKDSPNFTSRFVGMLLAAALLGFFIGGGLGILIFSVFHRFRSENFPVKKAIHIGGALGAISGALFFTYLVFQ